MLNSRQDHVMMPRVTARHIGSGPADWDRAIAVNLYGVLHTCQAVLPIMAGQGRGAVVNLGLASRATSRMLSRSSPQTRHPLSPVRPSGLKLSPPGTRLAAASLHSLLPFSLMNGCMRMTR
jgi:hypothetical protein